MTAFSSVSAQRLNICCMSFKRINKKASLLRLRGSKHLCVCLYLLSVPLCLSVARNILSQYNRSTPDQKGCWQESKSTQIPVVCSSYLTSRGLAAIPVAQRGLHSARHGAIGPAVEALCTLTPKEIESLVMEELSGGCLRGTKIRLLTVGQCVSCRAMRLQAAVNQESRMILFTFFLLIFL